MRIRSVRSRLPPKTRTGSISACVRKLNVTASATSYPPSEGRARQSAISTPARRNPKTVLVNVADSAATRYVL